MTYIEQAIKEAVEKGGYTAWGGLPIKPDQYGFMLLDTDFWQSLGKARGWEEKWDKAEKRPSGPMWKEYWVWFIKHLASGKDAESFFKELLSDKE